MTDLHLGGEGRYLWHNFELHEHALELATATVEAVNAAEPDFVVVTGDLTDRGTEDGFEAARTTLDRLRAPYFVLPGNHDVYTPGSRERLLEAFAGHIAPDRDYHSWAWGGVRCLALSGWDTTRDGALVDHTPQDRAERGGVVIPGEQLAWLERELQTQPDSPALIFIHYPLAPMAERVAALKPKEAGIVRNREEVLELLLRFPQMRAVFCGHQHYNEIQRVSQGGRDLLHCMLCANVEYPMMWREVMVDEEAVRVRTHLSPVGELRERSFAGAGWVTGTDGDREASIGTRAKGAREG